MEQLILLRQRYQYHEFAVESNLFQEYLIEDLKQRMRRQGLSLNIHPINNTVRKHTRIENLEPLIVHGMLRFSKRHDTLLNQLCQFPLGKYDDGPDALEMAVAIANRRHNTLTVHKLTGF